MNHQKNNNSSKVIADKRRLRFRLFKKFAVLISLVFVIAGTAGVSLHFRNSTQSRQAQTDYAKLVGDWGRTDGDYVIHISGINSDGTVQTAYFNPNPIHVAAANVSSQNKAVKLFVELRDEGYPGSKYELAYNAGQDILQGVYFQAQIQQFYDVVFQRMK